MIHDITTLTHLVNASLSATQDHMHACMQAVKEKDREAYNSHAKNLKKEVDQLTVHIKNILER